MKQPTLTQRLLSALVALCMVLSVCAPALAAEPGRASAAVIYYQKDGGKKTLLDALSIKTLMPGYKITFVRNLIIITMGSTEHTGELDGVTLSGNGSDPYNFELCTAGTNWVTDIRSSSNIGLTITGMKNVTVTPAKGSSIGFLGALKIVDCTGDVNLQNSSEGAVDGRLEVDNSAGHGSVTIMANCDRTSFGRYLPYGTTITSNGPVKIENKNGCAVCGSLEIKESASVDIKGTATNGRAAILGSATISSNGPVKIENQTSNDWKAGAAVGYKDDPNITGTILEVKKSASVEVIGAGVNPTLGGWASIKSSGDVSITNSLGGSAVGRGLTVTTGGAVTVTGDNDAAIKSKATITAGRNVSIQNKSGIATLNNDADITSRGAVSITNTGSGLAVSGDLTVHDSNSVKVSGGNASAPAVDGNITLTSSDKMELSNPKGQVTSKKLTVKNSTGEVSVTGNKSDGSALVQGGASIDTTGAVTITNSSGPAIFSGLNVKQSGGITVTGSQTSAPIITGNSTIKNTNKVEIINTDTNGQTAQNITYTPPAGKGYFYQTAQNGGKLHTRSAISSTTPYLCIEPDTLYTLTLPEGVTATTGGTKDTKFYAGESVTVTAPADTDTKKFESWTFSGTEPTGLPDGWEHKPSFSFTMPAGNVRLEAEYKTVYNVSVDDGKGTILVNGMAGSRALAGDQITVTEKGSDKYHLFSNWQLTSSTPLVRPSDNWENSKEFTFTMPAGDVSLKADYKQLYDLTVTGGTIVNGTNTGIYLPGTEVTIQFTESDDITKQFEKWTYTGTAPAAPDGGWPDGGWQNSPDFTFKMPEGNVSLRAEYRETYRIYESAGKAEFFAEGAEEQKIHEALPGTRIIAKVSDSELNDYCQFNMWQLASEKELMKPDQNWQGKQSFCFTMPEGDVELRAYFTTLYDVIVTHGTIVDGTGDTGTSQKIVKPGQLVTVRAESTEENPFLRWTYTGEAPVEPDDGWPEGGWQTSPEFTFKMPNGNVTLDAQLDQLYKVSINDSLGSVTINGEPRSSLWVKEGETVTVATTLKDGYWMEFEKWNSTGTAPEEPVGGWTETNKSTSTTFTFKMPNGPVELVAQWSASPVARPDPDEPLDEDFGVEPAPMDTTGGTIAAVAVGGAAIWGGYEIATRVILHSLLPEGTVILASRGQLALLVWNTAGRPEPAGAPAFADVTDPDMAKAAQWCTEQGTMAAKGDRFEPEGWTPKFKVIEVWNKAFPAA